MRGFEITYKSASKKERDKMNIKCAYCGKESEDHIQKECKGCGATLGKPEKEKFSRSDPFFYNGYIVYVIRDWLADTTECQFWLGRELIERICVTEPILRERVKEWEDSMPFFWDLFLLAHGEKEVLEWTEKNNKWPASFEIRRKENPEKERARSMPMSEIAIECALGG